jgi:hypothetical protein
VNSRLPDDQRNAHLGAEAPYLIDSNFARRAPIGNVEGEDLTDAAFVRHKELLKDKH